MPEASTPKTKSTNQQKFDLQKNPVQCCWSHGHKVKQGHNSGSTTNKNWIHPHYIIASTTTKSNKDTNNESNVYLYQHVLNSVVSVTASQPRKYYAILDSGETDHYLPYNPNPTYPGFQN